MQKLIYVCPRCPRRGNPETILDYKLECSGEEISRCNEILGRRSTFTGISPIQGWRPAGGSDENKILWREKPGFQRRER
ncbi:hypothetical protein A3D00_01700 [Candidatus Woesebacteria bacterium RIFCSPHIGHO2_02_FULL_38_9]|uniref:Uncharacterized protein n=1 Tax=Candidatus Woesebacteria bacterium RIFCSPHIGHO2_01_FULL_39_28 TaxID=1802496 RepID=A0A1F7YGY9_9BACT|nr:MAG: hypothetical protein A2627_03750 [Candidatus Woesebacteria bacterium RIFCSPHIGHO2_01_FULL_39_28]OGM33642.1 MAG: hypothetical protein A3D00_01700 [Candidatus Woesebacteria bacterium RIFCSPHIGHO2_02_FULL_38_9]OGM58537.1 MAG: hypothetical protein A3A50_00760 [Candidatus Woesebacteria bacterium RIFCSPLOWO2_01_FULL_38_20]